MKRNTVTYQRSQASTWTNGEKKFERTRRRSIFTVLWCNESSLNGSHRLTKTLWSWDIHEEKRVRQWRHFRCYTFPFKQRAKRVDPPSKDHTLKATTSANCPDLHTWGEKKTNRRTQDFPANQDLRYIINRTRVTKSRVAKMALARDTTEVETTNWGVGGEEEEEEVLKLSPPLWSVAWRGKRRTTIRLLHRFIIFTECGHCLLLVHFSHFIKSISKARWISIPRQNPSGLHSSFKCVHVPR